MSAKFHLKKIFYTSSSLVGVALATSFLTNTAYADILPSGSNVKSGSVDISVQDSHMVIQQDTEKAIIDWDSFSIGKQSSVHFNQPNTTSSILNRVVGNQKSTIAGTITATGQVFLVNPNGILLTKDSSVNVGGLTASTLDITNQNFLNSIYQFEKNTNTTGVAVENAGTITAKDGGFIALLGGAVSNTGTITARLGRVAVGAGRRMVLTFNDNALLRVEISTETLEKIILSSGKKINNTVNIAGDIIADGGHIEIKTSLAQSLLKDVINVSGVVKADSALQQNGKIVLSGTTVNTAGTLQANGINSAGDISVMAAGEVTINNKVLAKSSGGTGGNISVTAGQISVPSGVIFDVSGYKGGTLRLQSDEGVRFSGALKADGVMYGGRIDVTGKKLYIMSANITAIGTQQGGLVRIGGAFQGGTISKGLTSKQKHTFVDRWGVLPKIKASQLTFLSGGNVIDVSSDMGTGGTAIIWSDDTTAFYGEINATGFAKGGSIELSGKKMLKSSQISAATGNIVENIDLSMVNVGVEGHLLLDPKNVVLDNSSQVQYSYALDSTHVSLGDKIISNSGFGSALALSSDSTKLAVGAKGTTSVRGAVYLFKLANQSQWDSAFSITYMHKLQDLDLSSGAEYGASVAMTDDGKKLAVGAPKSKISGSVANGGVALYELDWTDTQTLSKPTRVMFRTHTPQRILTNDAPLYSYYLQEHNKFDETQDNTKVLDSEKYITQLTLTEPTYTDTNTDGTISDTEKSEQKKAHQDKQKSDYITARKSERDEYKTKIDALIGDKGKGRQAHKNGVLFGSSLAFKKVSDKFYLAVGAEGFDISDKSDNKTDRNDGAVYLFEVADKGNLKKQVLEQENGESKTVWGVYQGSGNTASHGELLTWIDGTENIVDSAGNLVKLYKTTYKARIYAKKDSSGSLLEHLSNNDTYDFREEKIAEKSGLGSALAFSDTAERVVIGAEKYSSGKGIVYLATWKPSTVINDTKKASSVFSYYGKLESPESGATFFGGSVATDSTAGNIAVGYTGYNSNTGAIKVFTSHGWTVASSDKDYIINNTNSPSLKSGSKMGTSVAMTADGSYVIGGAAVHDSNKGAIYTYKLVNATAILGVNVTSAENIDLRLNSISDEFASSVVLSGDGTKLAVGAKSATKDGIAGGDVIGAVYLYDISADASAITYKNKLSAPSGSNALQKNAGFGDSIALSDNGTKLAVGATGYDENSKNNSGAVYLYSGSWGSHVFKVKLSDSTSGITLSGNDNFGSAVALSDNGTKLAVGASGASLNLTKDITTGTGDDAKTETKTKTANIGAVYLFDWSSDSTATFKHTIDGKTIKNGADNLLTYENLNTYAGMKLGSSLALSNDGTRLFVGAAGGKTKITDTSDNNKSTEKVSGTIELYTLPSDWSGAVSATYKRSIRGDFLNGDTFAIMNPSTYTGQYVDSLAINSDGTKLLVGDASKTIRLYTVTADTFTGTNTLGVVKIANTINNTDNGFAHAITLSDDGTKLIVGSKGQEFGSDLGAVTAYNITDFSAASVTEKGTQKYREGYDVTVGSSISLSGDGNKLAVGSSGWNNDTGRVYLFTVDTFAANNFTVTYKNHKDGETTGDKFGSSVVFDNAGTRLAVGAMGKNTNIGKVYLYAFSTDWSSAVSITDKTPSSGLTGAANNENFGSAVAFNTNGTKLAVGAMGADSNAGKVYLYDLTGWASTITVKDTPTKGTLLQGTVSSTDNYGSAVALSGDGTKLAVGAMGADSKAGKVHLYTLSWTSTDVTATDKTLAGTTQLESTKAGDKYGSAVAFNTDATLLMIGASGAESNKGKVSLYTLDWTSTADTVKSKTNPFTSTVDKGAYGTGVTLSGDGKKFLITAPNDTSSRGGISAYFESASSWVEKQKIGYTHSQLTGPLKQGDSFGTAVALSGDSTKLAVGSTTSDNGNITHTGSVYLFSVKNWDAAGFTITLKHYIKSKVKEEFFGSAVAFNTDATKLAIGASGADTTNTGKVHLYSLSNWDSGSFTATVKTPVSASLLKGTTAGDKYGSAVAFNADGTKLAVGAMGIDSNKGKVYLYSLSNWSSGTFTETDKTPTAGTLLQGTTAGDKYGSAVTFNTDGTKLAIGAMGIDSNKGAIYGYKLDATTLTPTLVSKIDDTSEVLKKLFNPNNEAGKIILSQGDHFGSAVALNDAGDVLYIGAKGRDADKGAIYGFTVDFEKSTDLGATYKITLDNTVETLQGKIKDFGSAVAINSTGTRLAIGLPYTKSSFNSGTETTISSAYGSVLGITAYWGLADQVKAKLNKGENVSVVASNDITVNEELNVTGTGKLSLIAGRSIFINKNITSKGDLYFVANNTNAVISDSITSSNTLNSERDADIPARITMGSTVEINTTGNVVMEMQNGMGSDASKKYAGWINLYKVKASKIKINYTGINFNSNVKEDADGNFADKTGASVRMLKGGQLWATKDASKEEKDSDKRVIEIIGIGGASSMQLLVQKGEETSILKFYDDNLGIAKSKGYYGPVPRIPEVRPVPVKPVYTQTSSANGDFSGAAILLLPAYYTLVKDDIADKKNAKLKAEAEANKKLTPEEREKRLIVKLQKEFDAINATKKSVEKKISTVKTTALTPKQKKEFEKLKALFKKIKTFSNNVQDKFKKKEVALREAEVVQAILAIQKALTGLEKTLKKLPNIK